MVFVVHVGLNCASPKVVCLVHHFDLKICFGPQQRAVFSAYDLENKFRTIFGRIDVYRRRKTPVLCDANVQVKIVSNAPFSDLVFLTF